MNQPTYNFYHSPNLWFQINFNWFLFYKHLYIQLPSSLLSFRMYYPFLFKNTTKKAAVKPFLARIERGVDNELTDRLGKISVGTKTLFSVEHKWTMFLLYFQFMSSRGTNYMYPHANFKNMFLLDDHRGVRFYNAGRISMRWTHAYNLILNIFFKQLSLVAFSTKVFRKEVTSFNWSYDQRYTLIDNSLFKRASNFIFFKNARYGLFTRLMSLERESQDFQLSFVTDIKYHEKTIFFLRRFGSYTLGVVPFNMDPWLVSYCIPISTNNIMIELFFFKFLSFLRQYAALKSYNNSHELWKQL